jgi:membrane associated rhomboid family serine protease
MFPYRDDNPTLRTPVVTLALIALNAVIWGYVQGFGSEQLVGGSICRLGLVPAEILGRVRPGEVIQLGPGATCPLSQDGTWLTALTSMFLHGGWMHLIGNMWFLWIFGNNVEDSMGRIRFVAFYLICGLAAAALQVFLSPSSRIPRVGATGAISGIMGAYVLLYPKVRVHLIYIIIFFIGRFTLPAWMMLGYWFLIQLLGGWASWGDEGGGTAFWAHVGGFAAGALLIPIMQDRELVARHRAAILRHVYG